MPKISYSTTVFGRLKLPKTLINYTCALFRRLSEGSAQVDGKFIEQISRGTLNLMFEMAEYTEKEAEQLVIQNSKIRFFKAHNGKLKLALLDTVVETCDEPIYTIC